MEGDNRIKGTLSLNNVNGAKKRNPVIKSRQTNIKHNPSTFATPYKPKTNANPLAQQIEKFQSSSIGRELGYSNSELEAVVRNNPDAAKEMFIKMKEDERYGASELRSLGGGDSVYVNRESESVVSHHNLGSQSNPLDIMAGRMSGKDVTGLHSFVSHADRAREMMSSGVNMNPHSEDPAEVIAYRAREKNIDLGGLSSRLKSSPSYKFSDVKEIVGARNNTQALTVYKAMTGEDQSQQQVDKADLITPQMYKDASSDRFIQNAVKVTSAFNRITDYYINPLELQKDSGLGDNADLESTRRRVKNYLERELPPQVTNQAIHFAQGGKGAWADALPHPDAVAAHLSKSKFASKYTPYLRTSASTDELSSMGLDASLMLKPNDFKDDLKTIQGAFKASNEGGLRHTFDPDMRSNVHELDAMSRLGDANSSIYEVGSSQSDYIDPITGVRSEEYLDYIKSDATDQLDNIYEALGIQRDSLDPREDNKIPPTSKEEKAAVRAMLEEVEKKGSSVLEQELEVSKALKERNGLFAASSNYTTTSTSSAGTGTPFNTSNQGPKAWPAGAENSESVASAYSKNNGEKFWDGGKTAKPYLQGTAKDLEENKRRQDAFFNSNSNLSFLSNDDDKHEEGSVWHQKRQGLFSSSVAPSITNPKKAGAAIKGLFTDALKSDKEKMFKPSPNDFNINFSAGDALEEQGIGWYKSNVDDSIFEPGMLKSVDPIKRGQSTTPDAMTSDGKKVVEFKSAQALTDPYADPSTQEGRNQRSQWQTYYSQLQHQMYMTGAETGDIVQMQKDPLNPHLPDGGKFTSDNIQRKTYARDDDYIKRMSPVWEKLGQSADDLSGLDPKIQKNLAKAVSEGNIDSFEKLSKKHGFDSDGGIRDSLFGPSAGGGGRGGGGGRSIGGLTGAHSGSTGSIARSIASMTPVGRFINAGLAIGKAAYNTIDGLNDESLDLMASSRSAGYQNEDMFRLSRNSMMRNRALTMSDAIHDISVLTDASGGLQSGHTGAAVNIVEATRGAVSFEDIYNIDPTDEHAINNLISSASQKLSDAGHSPFAVQAMMKRANIKSGLSLEGDTIEGRENLNAGLVSVKSAIETMKTNVSSAVGTSGANTVDAINAIYNELFGKSDATRIPNTNLGGRSSAIVTEDSPREVSDVLVEAIPNTTTRAFGPTKAQREVEESIEDAMNRPARAAPPKNTLGRSKFGPTQAQMDAYRTRGTVNKSLSKKNIDFTDPNLYFNESNYESMYNYVDESKLDATMINTDKILGGADDKLIEAINKLVTTLMKKSGDKVAISLQQSAAGVQVVVTDEDGNIVSRTGVAQ